MLAIVHCQAHATVNPNPSPAIPRWVLLALTLAVLLVHGWLLETAPRALDTDPAPADDAPLSFVTRTVMRPPAQSTLRPTEVAMQAPAPGPAPKATPQPTALPRAPVTITETPTPEETTDKAATEETDAVAEPPSAEAASTAASQAPEPAAPTPPALPATSPPLAPRTQLPAPMRLKYTVQANKFPFSLNAELLWQHDGVDYNAQLAFSAFGQSRVQTSRGNVGAQGLAPTRFSDKYRSELAAHFNREAGKITFSANTPDAPLMAGAQDRLSILVQLATLFAGDPGAYPQATTITLQTAGPRDASPWLFTVQAAERLVLPGGEQDTVKLVRLPRRDYDQKVELWLAPALDYLPARIKITEHNGDYIDQQWQATEVLK